MFFPTSSAPKKHGTKTRRFRQQKNARTLKAQNKTRKTAFWNRLNVGSGQHSGRSGENVEERKVRPVWLHQVGQEARGPGEPLVQAVRTVGGPGLAELRHLHELGELQGAVKVRVVVRQTVQQEEDEPAAGDAVADSGPFAKQAALPRQLATPDAGVQVAVILEVKVRRGEQVDYA